MSDFISSEQSNSLKLSHWALSVFPTPENCPFPQQTSLYGASKLAGEAILSAYAQGYGINATVFRFVSILGPRYTHGHIIDFMRKLRANPERLDVLGDGNQLKSYLHIADLMTGLYKIITHEPKGFNVFNIGHDEAITVRQSIGFILSELKLKPELVFAGGTRGWIGDSPRIQLATNKLKALGWKYERTLEQGVRDTVKYLQENEFLFDEVKS